MSEDYILYGPELHMPVPKESLGRLVYNNMLQHLNELAFLDETTEENLLYKDVLDVTVRLAESLRNCGYTEKNLLGICSENSIHFFSPLLAALYLGMITVPISQYYSEDEVQHTINITQPTIVFCSENTVDQFIDLKEKNKCIRKIIVMGVKENVDGAETLETFLNQNSRKTVDFRRFLPVGVNTEEQTALILFSSGTTGLPKGVMITHKNCLMRIVHMYDTRMHFNTIADTTNLCYLPFYHASGLISTLGSIILGKPNIVLPRFEERLFLGCIEKYKVPVIAAVPTLLVLLSKSSAVDDYDLSSLNEIIVGAAPVGEDLEREVKERLKVNSIRQVYGMTETTLAVISVPAGVQRQGSSGTVTPGMACIVRDPNTGKNLKANQVGELCFKGAMVMKGYYNNPKATIETFTHDGWLRTGDLGYYDNDGYFYIVDRLKELIKYKSFQVPPAEIEALLLKNPKIKEAAVIGLPDERAGELPLAFIVKQPDVDVTEEEIIKYVASRLSRQKHLHGGVRFIDDLPKNMSGKILRRELRQMLKEMKSKL